MSGAKGKSGVYERTAYHRKRLSESNMGIIPSKETNRKISITKLTENPSYMAIHSWVRNHKGKPKKCKDCGITSDIIRLHWANIDHKYKRNLDDYMAMCPKCHKKHDMGTGLARQ